MTKLNKIKSLMNKSYNLQEKARYVEDEIFELLKELVIEIEELERDIEK